jgi:predicted dehydrogenase
MSKIKIGQIGVGHAHADGKMGVYRGSAEFEVVGVVEPNEELRAKAQASDTYKGLKWMSEDQLLATPELKAVAVETQVRDLLPTAMRCIEAGKHIHLDKPAGASLPEFRRLLDAASRAHLTVQMGYMYRYSPAVLMLRDFLKKGWLGEPFEVHTVMSKVVNPASRKRLSDFPGGMMFELGCHIVDLVVDVLGAPTHVAPFVQHASTIEDNLNDNMLAVLTYPRAIASVKSSAMEVEGFARRHFVVCGTEGTMHIEPLDAPHVRIALSKPRDAFRKGYQTVRFGDYPRYVGDSVDLARIIRGEKDPDYGYEHDYEVQKTLLKACSMPLN